MSGPNKPQAIYELSVRARHTLGVLGVQTIDDVIEKNLSAASLSRVRGCGSTTIREIRRWAKAHGLDIDDAPYKLDIGGLTSTSKACCVVVHDRSGHSHWFHGAEGAKVTPHSVCIRETFDGAESESIFHEPVRIRHWRPACGSCRDQASFRRRLDRGKEDAQQEAAK